MVNWTWYPSGGDWTYIENLSFVYKSNGHQIIPFSMQHNENFESEYSKFFIKKIDYKSLHQKNKFVAGLDVISRGIYSFEAVNKLKALLKHVKIELAHINIITNFAGRKNKILEEKTKQQQLRGHGRRDTPAAA